MIRTLLSCLALASLGAVAIIMFDRDRVILWVGGGLVAIVSLTTAIIVVPGASDLTARHAPAFHRELRDLGLLP